MAKDDFDAKHAIKEIEQANEGVKFDTKVQESICRSSPVQKEIKKLIWAAVKDKLLWFAIALIVFLGSHFLGGMAQELGRKIAE